MDELLNQIADETGVPADLLERAARARATAQGVDVGGLVAGWAGGDTGQTPPPAAAPPAAPPPAPAAAPEPAPAPQPEPAAAPVPAAAPAAGRSLEEMLGQISGDTEVPADLLERAARARAGKAGTDVAALVAGWTGEAAATPAAAPPPPQAAPAEPAAAPAPAADSGAGQLPEALLRRSAAARAKREGRPLDEVLVEMGLSPEGETPAPPAAEPVAAQATAAAPAAAQEAAEEEPAAEEPAVAEEPQSVFAGFPRWLAASFILIPMIALLYAGLAPHGPDCGQSGQLDINPLTGEAQGCAGDASPFFSLGQSIYNAQCTACHGAGGGGGVGPAFTGGAVLVTFSACNDHVEWVAIGTNDWPDATYGDTAKPAGGGGVMPGYQNSLSFEEIAAVSLYERVAFGGEDLAVAEVSCGLVPGEEG